MNTQCFKAYDIRGRVPEELNPTLARKIGQSVAEFLLAKSFEEPFEVERAIVVGRDVRESSESLARALSEGIMDAGVKVYDIGLCGTEEVYFATAHYQALGGICVTASHNPKHYNGMKLVAAGASPISSDSGLKDIRLILEAKEQATDRSLFECAHRGSMQRIDHRQAFVEHLLQYIDVKKLSALKLVVNPGNGGAGLIIDALESSLPFSWIKLNHTPDGTFPAGVPNPLLPENRSQTSGAVIEHSADLGIAWDGDFDRCFLFDEKGRFIEGYYLVGLLASLFLTKHPNQAIIHDSRLIWNTQEIVSKQGGKAIENKTGHAFMKERMRLEQAVYGGEMSAHHYFKDFFYCDSGMIPWLLITEYMSISKKRLSDLLSCAMQRYPISGEINRRVENSAEVIEYVRSRLFAQAQSVSEIDGLSMDMGDWRFNLRPSNTESLLRLNVESRDNRELLKAKTHTLLGYIEKFSL